MDRIPPCVGCFARTSLPFQISIMREYGLQLHTRGPLRAHEPALAEKWGVHASHLPRKALAQAGASSVGVVDGVDVLVDGPEDTGVVPHEV